MVFIGIFNPPAASNSLPTRDEPREDCFEGLEGTPSRTAREQIRVLPGKSSLSGKAVCEIVVPSRALPGL